MKKIKMKKKLKRIPSKQSPITIRVFNLISKEEVLLIPALIEPLRGANPHVVDCHFWVL
jgi:hypothetical protein